MTSVHLEVEAEDRLRRFGLTTPLLHRVLLRADAEVAQVTALEPPNAAGVTRYNKTTRFLREELLPSNWRYTNASNFCRIISPDESFAIVASSGDGGAGIHLPGQQPSTRYPKGETTVRAVEKNQQLTFDLGSRFAIDAAFPDPMSVWYLLYHVTREQIFCELSLPMAITNGFINSWVERIILPPIERPGPSTPFDDFADDDGPDYEVHVTRRA